MGYSTERLHATGLRIRCRTAPTGYRYIAPYLKVGRYLGRSNTLQYLLRYLGLSFSRAAQVTATAHIPHWARCLDWSQLAIHCLHEESLWATLGSKHCQGGRYRHPVLGQATCKEVQAPASTRWRAHPQRLAGLHNSSPLRLIGYRLHCLRFTVPRYLWHR